MALYREHSGGLMESHDTVITGECLDDLNRYYARDTRINGWESAFIAIMRPMEPRKYHRFSCWRDY